MIYKYIRTYTPGGYSSNTIFDKSFPKPANFESDIDYINHIVFTSGKTFCEKAFKEILPGLKKKYPFMDETRPEVKISFAKDGATVQIYYKEGYCTEYIYRNHQCNYLLKDK